MDTIYMTKEEAARRRRRLALAHSAQATHVKEKKKAERKKVAAETAKLTKLLDKHAASMVPDVIARYKACDESSDYRPDAPWQVSYRFHRKPHERVRYLRLLLRLWKLAVRQHLPRSTRFTIFYQRTWDGDGYDNLSLGIIIKRLPIRRT